MSGSEWNSLRRVLTTLGHAEPDRVPLFLLTPMHGAKFLGLSIEEYFSRAENVIEGQLLMRERYGGDCLFAFLYAGIETEAWGGRTIFRSDGPPNSGKPVIPSIESIRGLAAPRIAGNPPLQKVLETIRGLKARAADDVPIIGVVMSPFSFPVMQLGFERYLDLMHDDDERFAELMAVNEGFCVEWANAQLEAGATAICYFDPVSSTTVVPRGRFLSTGYAVARRTLARIKGPTALHLASGRGLPIMGDLAGIGTAAVGVSAIEDLSVLKAAAGGKVALIGNLNGIEMRRWTPAEAEAAVRSAITKAGPGGGFILSDNHGEIPWQVQDEILLAISEAARRWGRYPIDTSGTNRG